jgi:ribosomal protein S18 acetylase RimI-like enzyme
MEQLNPFRTAWLSQVKIRHLLKEDLSALEWEGRYSHFRQVYAEAYKRSCQGMSVLWVAEIPVKGIIGQVFIQMACDRPELADGSQRAYLYSFRIRPEYRSAGLGGRILEVVMSDLRRRGFKEISLNVAQDNPRALKFYEKYNFHIVAPEPGRWTYPDDKGVLQTIVEPAWRMEKTL